MYLPLLLLSSKNSILVKPEAIKMDNFAQWKISTNPVVFFMIIFETWCHLSSRHGTFILYAPAGSWCNFVGTAPGFNLLLFFIRNCEANTESPPNSHQQSAFYAKTSARSVAFQWARVLWTCFSHLHLRTPLLGKLSKFTRSLGVLEHPAATHLFTISLPVHCTIGLAM